MTSVSVDSSLIRYSHIEGTHYFYDPAHPKTIQFLLNGKWEPWDIAWVRSRAQDPEVRRIAEDAETRSPHERWPGHPPSASADANFSDNSYGPSRASGNATLSSPVASNANEAPRHISDTYLPHVQPLSNSPSPVSPLSPRFPPSVQGTRSQSYTSPYAAEPTASTPTTTQSSGFPQVQSAWPSDTAGSNNEPPNSHLPQAPDEPAMPFYPPANRDTKILLSLDGDGVRGLSTVLLVESLVNAVCSKLGRRVDPFQIFDLIGGVSTTGLLAIMIGRLRMRAHRAREAYVSIAQAMYMDKWQFFVSLDPQVQLPAGAPMLETGIEDLITKESENPDELFFDTRTDSTNVFLISTKVEIGANQPAIIRSYPTRRMAGPELDANLTVRQAFHAAVQAPRYMDPLAHTRRAVIQPGLVDYGTGKNNPVRDLYYECRKLYSYTNDTMVVVSLGTGAGFDRMEEIYEMVNSVADRQSEAQGIADKFEADNRNLIDQNWMKYFRFNVPDLSDVRLDESLEVDKVMAKTHEYLAHPEVGQKFYACVDIIVGVLKGDIGSWPHFFG